MVRRAASPTWPGSSSRTSAPAPRPDGRLRHYHGRMRFYAVSAGEKSRRDATVSRENVSVRELLRRPVMLDDILLGAPTDAVLDSDSLRVVGLEIECGDGARRFLPLAAARIRADHVAVGSALMLLEDGVRDFYRRRTEMFS